MGYIVLNSNGSVAASAGSSSGGGGSGKSMLGPFVFWSPQNDLPTAYTNMQYPLVGWNNGSVAVMNAGVKIASAGYVNALAMSINGPTNGNAVSTQFYKNGVAQNLIATGTGASGTTTPVKTAGGAGFSFAADDVLSIYIQAAASGINQSFSAFLELVLS